MNVLESTAVIVFMGGKRSKTREHAGKIDWTDGIGARKQGCNT
jgi:hypothetical protein